MPTPMFTPTNRNLKPAPGQLINFRIQRPGVNPNPPGLYEAAGPVPGLYSQETAAPALSAPPPVPRIPSNFAPSTGDGSSGGGVLAPDAAAGGAALPVGAAVEGAPGLFESVRTTPRLNDPAGVAVPGSAFTASGTAAKAAAAPSRYTLTQTTPPASSRPVSPLDANADTVALASLFGAGAPAGEHPSASHAGAGAALAAADSFGELGAPGSALQAAQGLERTRLGLAAQRIMQREAPNLPQAGQSPEIQASRLAYMTKRVGGAAAAAGLPADTGALARTAAEITRNAGQPRLVNLGTDSSGKPVEGTLDANRNFSRIAPKDSTTGETQLAKLVAERDAFHAAGRADIVKQYDEAITNYGAKYDAFGNPITRPGGAAASTNQTPASPAPAKPMNASPDVNAQALAWANANPNDPRSAQIKARLGAAK